MGSVQVVQLNNTYIIYCVKNITFAPLIY